ncbi:hypothetical protein AVEN_166198-1 [Araneus ventricosus]|uniref:F-box domain-containing protein n=1 Tax=Araneus ventricosus TaxID=182803 RepID=A0A4Y2DB52_ARAVE|nr:hypothetical protein AVEN_166198-1 [Araneus ventricosus]
MQLSYRNANMSEKWDNETAESLASVESQKCKEQGQWLKLPSLPLENIYSFLRREDQVNMSLVCRKWSEGYGTPSVWKTFIFDVTETQLSTNNCLVEKFAQKCSSMFRHVEIKFLSYKNKHWIETWCRKLILFLQILINNSQLISVKFRCPFWKIDTPTYDAICRTIVDFLRSQQHLKRVEFRYCSFKFHEGVEILRKLTENNRGVHNSSRASKIHSL